MKIAKHGRVVIDENNIRAEGFVFEGSNEPIYATSLPLVNESARLVLQWAYARIHEELIQLERKVKRETLN